jgi:K+-sensing histidine kinase KdpD
VELGLVVAASFILVESVAVLLLKQVAPGSAFGVVYLIGILVVAPVWGFGLAATMSVASAIAFDYFRDGPTAFTLTRAENLAVIGSSWRSQWSPTRWRTWPGHVPSRPSTAAMGYGC